MTTMTTNPISYLTFMKHAEKLTKRVSSARPILKGVNHLDEGIAACTDSHVLYHAITNHSQTAGTTTDPKTGEDLTHNGTYPDVSRLVPQPGDERYKFTLDTKEIHAALQALHKMAKHDKGGTGGKSPVNLIIKDERLTIDVQNGPFSAQYETTGHTPNNEDTTVILSINYLIDVLALLKDAGRTQFNLCITSSTRQVSVTDTDNSFTAILMPIRNY